MSQIAIDCDTCFYGTPPFPNVKCCFNCARNADICKVSHRCGQDCPKWQDKTHTNADRIRAMSDKQLSILLCLDGFHDQKTCLKWLRQPAGVL